MEKELMRLRKKAKRMGKTIRMNKATGGYMLIDLHMNAVVAGPAPLESLAGWLQWEVEQEERE